MNESVVPFPVSDEERARRLKAEVDRLARLPTVEWMYYLDGTVEKYGVDKAVLKQMVEVVIREVEKKAREDRGELRRREDRAEKKRDVAQREQDRKAERRTREEERRTERRIREDERREREAQKEAEKRERETQKALAVIVKLPSAEHEAELKKLAKRLDEDIETLRAEFDELLGDEAEKIRRGIVEPWDEPVATRELLDVAMAQFAKYIIIHDKVVAPIVPVWIAFAWIHDIAAFSPILVFQGADTGMGKSNASEAVKLLSPRGYMLAKPTGPSLYRLVDYMRPTLFIDDADKLLAEDRDLATIIRSSWKRGVYVPRVVKGTVYLFDAFGPRCLNGIDLLAHLDAATRTRCITIRMLPKLENETVASMRYAGEDENFVILRRKFLRWATDNMAALKTARPRMPEGFFSRLEENYHLLFAIADLAGGDWPKKIRAAAVKLSQERDTPSLGKRLLAIFFALFVRHGSQITSKQAEALVPVEDDEFADYRSSGRPITRFQIAALLRPYQVYPGLIHPRGGHTADRGWNATSFTTVFKHYLGKTLPEGRSVVRKQRPKK
jgi:hypothetical protein